MLAPHFSLPFFSSQTAIGSQHSCIPLLYILHINVRKRCFKGAFKYMLLKYMPFGIQCGFHARECEVPSKLPWPRSPHLTDTHHILSLMNISLVQSLTSHLRLSKYQPPFPTFVSYPSKHQILNLLFFPCLLYESKSLSTIITYKCL